jgi:hypothetical protein
MTLRGKYKCRFDGNGYYKVTVDSYDTFIHEIAPEFLDAKDIFVWRGMRDSTWDLLSSLSRELSKMKKTKHEWDEAATEATIQQLRFYLENLRGLSQLQESYSDIYHLLGEQTKGMRSFLEVLDKLKAHKNTIFELFSIGQHHEMLTPFLDWSTNPLVALYFAFEEYDHSRAEGVGDRVIYALNRTEVEKECPPNGRLSEGSVIFTDSMAYDNPRIIGQNGLFTYIPASQPLNEWVVDRKNFQRKREPILIQFIIQNKGRTQCLRELEQIGIDARSIYPDLKGAAVKANNRLKTFLQKP